MCCEWTPASHSLIRAEPGFYVDGEYGIRLENVVEVTEAVTPVSLVGVVVIVVVVVVTICIFKWSSLSFCFSFSLQYNFSGPSLTFWETTLVPYEPKLIDTTLLTLHQVLPLTNLTTCLAIPSTTYTNH